jgi:hypothetical protein
VVTAALAALPRLVIQHEVAPAPLACFEPIHHGTCSKIHSVVIEIQQRSARPDGLLEGEEQEARLPKASRFLNLADAPVSFS